MSATGTRTLRAYASLFNTPYVIGRGSPLAFTETVAPGAFRDTLQQGAECIFRVDHAGPPLGATWNGTLRLEEDGAGLRYQVDLDPRDPDAAALIPKLENGTLRESSFAFRATDDEWNLDRSERRIHAADLHRGDVSIVVWGASSATREGVTLRGHNTPFEMRRTENAGRGLDVTSPGFFLALDGRELRSLEDYKLTQEARRTRTDDEVEALGRQGKALWVNGHYAWPIEDVTDLTAAVQSFGRAASSAGAAAIRAWIIKRARALDATDLLPQSWNVNRRSAADAHDGDRARTPAPPARLRALRPRARASTRRANGGPGRCGK